MAFFFRFIIFIFAINFSYAEVSNFAKDLGCTEENNILSYDSLYALVDNIPAYCSAYQNKLGKLNNIDNSIFVQSCNELDLNNSSFTLSPSSCSNINNCLQNSMAMSGLSNGQKKDLMCTGQSLVNDATQLVLAKTEKDYKQKANNANLTLITNLINELKGKMSVEDMKSFSDCDELFSEEDNLKSCGSELDLSKGFVRAIQNASYNYFLDLNSGHVDSTKTDSSSYFYLFAKWVAIGNGKKWQNNSSNNFMAFPNASKQHLPQNITLETLLKNDKIAFNTLEKQNVPGLINLSESELNNIFEIAKKNSKDSDEIYVNFYKQIAQKVVPSLCKQSILNSKFACESYKNNYLNTLGSMINPNSGNILNQLNNKYNTDAKLSKKSIKYSEGLIDNLMKDNKKADFMNKFVEMNINSQICKMKKFSNISIMDSIIGEMSAKDQKQKNEVFKTKMADLLDPSKNSDCSSCSAIISSAREIYKTDIKDFPSLATNPKLDKNEFTEAGLKKELPNEFSKVQNDQFANGIISKSNNQNLTSNSNFFNQPVANKNNPVVENAPVEDSHVKRTLERRLNELSHRSNELKDKLSSGTASTTEQSEFRSIASELEKLRAEMQAQRKENADLKQAMANNGPQKTGVQTTVSDRATTSAAGIPTILGGQTRSNGFEERPAIAAKESGPTHIKTDDGIVTTSPSSSSSSGAVRSNLAAAKSDALKSYGLVLTKNGELSEDFTKIAENPKENDLQILAVKSDGKPFLIKENGELVQVSMKLDSTGKPVMVNGKIELIKKKLSKDIEQKIARILNPIQNTKMTEDMDQKSRVYDLHNLTRRALGGVN